MKMKGIGSIEEYVQLPKFKCMMQTELPSTAHLRQEKAEEAVALKSTAHPW